jgi:hypothetical protein
MLIRRVLLAATMVAACANPALSDAAFYPARPSGTLSQIQGTLTVYGHGNELGGFTIVDKNKVSHTFYMGKNMQVNGKRVYCGRAPTSTYKPNTTIVCPDWPSSIVIGHSIVNVLYWNTTYQGAKIQASDSITLVTP